MHMIPRDDKIITLAIDVRSFKQISSSQWKDLEELYTLVYVERYTEDNSILYWETDDGRSITLPYYVDCKRTAKQIMWESARLTDIRTENLCVVTADRYLCRELRLLPCMTVEAGDGLPFYEAHMLADYYMADESILIETLSVWQCMFPGEAAARGKKPICPPAMTRLHSEGYKFPLYVCGRYFPGKSQDIYTDILRKIASGKPMEQSMIDMLKSVVRWICRVQKIDAILSVPPKPGEKSKCAEVIAQLAEAADIENMDNAIFCCKNYPAMSRLTKEERKKAVRNAFASRRGYSYKKRFLILDDVVTTGITLEEMVQELLTVRAEYMVFLVLGITQNSV